MNFTVKSMDRDGAREILGWNYASPYDFYNMDNSHEGMDELLNGTYYKFLDNEVLIGYCCFGNSAQVPMGLQYGAYPENNSIDMGLGMRPNLTGKGYGFTFVSSILEFAQNKLNAHSFRLTVASFNMRAIALYRKLGFKPVMVFSRGDVEFFTMEK